MPTEPIAIMWIKAEDYPRFVELFGPDVQVSHEAYERVVVQLAADIGRQGGRSRRVIVEPDAMAEWCMDQFGRIDSKARATYVSHVALQSEAPES